MNYTDIIFGNEKALKKDGVRSLLIGSIGLIAVILFVFIAQRISFLMLFFSMLSLFVGFGKLRSIGACKIELEETEFTIIKRGLIGTSIKTYEKSKVENLQVIESKKLKQLNQALQFEEKQFIVQFLYEKRFVFLRPEQFIQVGQKFAHYFEYPINQDR